MLAGNQLARWFGVAVLGLSAIDQMFFIPAYPFWSLTIIAVDVVALYGLCAYGSRANLEPPRTAAVAVRTSVSAAAWQPAVECGHSDGEAGRPLHGNTVTHVRGAGRTGFACGENHLAKKCPA